MSAAEGGTGYVFPRSLIPRSQPSRIQKHNLHSAYVACSFLGKNSNRWYKTYFRVAVRGVTIIRRVA